MDVFDIIAIVLFAAGFVFVGVEMFMPGFGWPGISGIICFVAGIFLVAKSFVQGVIIALITAAVIGLLFVIIMRLLSKGKLKSPLILKEEVSENGGYVGTRGLEHMVGAEGVAVTDLHPAGVGRFGDDELDVVTTGKFIARGTAIAVIKAEGYRLVVAVKENLDSQEISEVQTTEE